MPQCGMLRASEVQRPHSRPNASLRFEPLEQFFDKLVKFVQVGQGVLEFKKGFEFAFDEIEIETLAAPDQNSTNVEPVLIASGKDFVDDQIIGGASAEFALPNVPEGRTKNRVFFEWQGTERDIKRGVVGVAGEQDTMFQGKSPGVVAAAFEGVEQGINEGFFCAKAGKKGEIGITGHAGFSPTLHCQAADEA